MRQQKHIAVAIRLCKRKNYSLSNPSQTEKKQSIFTHIHQLYLPFSVFIIPPHPFIQNRSCKAPFPTLQKRRTHSFFGTISLILSPRIREFLIKYHFFYTRTDVLTYKCFSLFHTLNPRDGTKKKFARHPRVVLIPAIIVNDPSGSLLPL